MSVAASATSMPTADSMDDQRFDDKQVLGSPQYMAPEIILRRPYGKPVDWWSMGIIFYEMLVGITPFTANSVDDLFTSIIGDMIEWPDDFENDVARDLILQLLRRSPELRLTTLRDHPLYYNFDWDHVLLRKADTIPRNQYVGDDEYVNTLESSPEDDNFESDSTNTDDIHFEFSFSSCSTEYLNLENSSSPELDDEQDMDEARRLKASLSSPSTIIQTSSTSSTISPKPSIRDRLRSRVINRSKSMNTMKKLPSIEHLHKRRKSRLLLGSIVGTLANNIHHHQLTSAHSVVLKRESGGFGVTFTTKLVSSAICGTKRVYQHSVLSVVPESPAAKAGIKPSQILYSLNGRSVRRMNNQKVVEAFIKAREEIQLQIADVLVRMRQ
ncbi:hypothetical protein ACOME3_001643 [Neoechinorhynchus agilis]